MIGEKLKELRESLGMNKKEFAQSIGIKYTTYNNYETEAREPASDFLILISDKFDVSIDYLLGRNAEKEILHSYQLKSSEYDHIKKYRLLDAPGREHVDTVLQWETEHKQQLLDSADKVIPLPDPSPSLVNAAHALDGASPEDVQHDEDIMDDENF